MYHEIEARIHYKIIVNMTEDFSLKFLIFVNISEGPKFNFWLKLDQWTVVFTKVFRFGPL